MDPLSPRIPVEVRQPPPAARVLDPAKMVKVVMREEVPVRATQPGLVPVVEWVLKARISTPYERVARVIEAGVAGVGLESPGLSMAELLGAVGPLSRQVQSELNEVSRVFRHEFIAVASLALVTQEALTRLPAGPPVTAGPCPAGVPSAPPAVERRGSSPARVRPARPRRQR